jgi:hypothetical protein
MSPSVIRDLEQEDDDHLGAARNNCGDVFWNLHHWEINAIRSMHWQAYFDAQIATPSLKIDLF